MNLPSLNAYKRFIAGYKIVKDKIVTQQSDAILAILPKFMEGYYHIKEKEIYENQNTAPAYNIFKIARFETLETKLHSPFIANLLDPTGSHSQGSLFLESFFQFIPTFNESFLKTWDYKYLKVTNESNTGFYGNIDIMLRYNNPHHPYLIIIENKIYAGDQELQIEKYYKYAKKSLMLEDSQIKILYLSLTGYAPSKYSISEEECNRLSSIGVFHNISYEKNIIPWLENVMANIEAPIVKYTVHQYLNTLKSLIR